MMIDCTECHRRIDIHDAENCPVCKAHDLCAVCIGDHEEKHGVEINGETAVVIRGCGDAHDGYCPDDRDDEPDWDRKLDEREDK